MPVKELRAKSAAELERMLAETRARLRERRVAVAANQWKDVREVRELRKTIAQLMTVLNEKQENEAEKAN